MKRRFHNCPSRRPLAPMRLRLQLQTLLACLVALIFCSTDALADDHHVPRFIRENPSVINSEWLRADFFQRANFDDQTNDVNEIVENASTRGFDVIAVVDHQTQKSQSPVEKYATAIADARLAHPEMVILSGLHWKVLTTAGEHDLTILMPAGPDEFRILREFKKQFCKSNDSSSDSQLAQQSLQWLEEQTSAASKPVVLANSTRWSGESSGEIIQSLVSLRRNSALVVGFPIFAPLVDRDRIETAEQRLRANGVRENAWNQLLSRGNDVHAAFSHSRIHQIPSAEPSAGELAETWLHVEKQTATGVLDALQNGSFFTSRGGIVRGVQFSASVAGLQREVTAGEEIIVAVGTSVRIILECEVPDQDMAGNSNWLDNLEFTSISHNGIEKFGEDSLQAGTARFEWTMTVPEGGMVLRAGGHREGKGNEKLHFYTNSIRIRTEPSTKVWTASDVLSSDSIYSVLKYIAVAVVGLVVFLLSLRRFTRQKRRGRRSHSAAPAPRPLSIQKPTAPGAASAPEVDWQPPVEDESPIQLPSKTESKRFIEKPPMATEIIPLSWEEHSHTRSNVLWIFTALVILVAIAFGYTMMTQEAVVKGTKHFAEGWAPQLNVILTSFACFLSLVAVPRYPIVGILSFFVISHVFPRYSTENMFLYSLRVPECISGLALLGACLSQEFIERKEDLRKSPVMWLLLAFVGWASLSAAVATFTTDVPADYRHYPLRLLNIFSLGVIAATLSWSNTKYLILAAVCSSVLLTRRVCFPLQTYLDGDLGYLLTGVIPVCVAATVTCKSIYQKTSLGIIASLLVILVFQVQSRGTIVGIITAVIVAWAVSPKRMEGMLLATPFAVVGIYLAWSGNLVSRFKVLWTDGIHSGSSGARLEIWSAVPSLLEGHWVFGRGLGRFSKFIGDFNPKWSNYAAHNNFLGVLVETGIPGLILYVALFACVVGYLVRSILKKSSYSNTNLELGFLAAIVGLEFCGLFITRYDNAFRYALIGIAAAQLLGVTKPHDSSADKKKSTSSSPLTEVEPSDWGIFPTQFHFLLMTFFFVCFVIYGSLVPFSYTPISFEVAAERFVKVTFSSLNFQLRADWVSNILLFIPVGFLAFGGVSVDKPRSRSLWFVPFVIVNCALLSSLIEFSQLWFPPRVVSQNDIAAETIGGAIGVFIWLIAGQRITESIRRYATLNEKHERVTWMLGGYLICLLVYSLMPFDLTIQPIELYNKYIDGHVEVIPFSMGYATLGHRLYGLLVDFVVFIPVGVLLAIINLKRPSSKASPIRPILMGGVIVVGIEFFQLFVLSRFTSTTDIFICTTGVTFGVAAYSQFKRSSLSTAHFNSETNNNSFFMLFCFSSIAYAVFLCLLFWFPFNFTRDPHVIKGRLDIFLSIPLERFHQGHVYVAFFSMVRKFVWFLPLGILLSLTSLEIRGGLVKKRWCTILLIFFFVMVCCLIEFCQILLPDHVADISDIAFYLVGGGMGAFIFKLLGTSNFRSVPEESDLPVQTRNSAETFSNSIRENFGRIPGMDGIRAIACLSVFGVHFQQITNLEGTLGPFDLSRLLLNGNTGVCLLFMLSGFFLSLPLWLSNDGQRVFETLKGFSRKRIARIVPAYYLCLALLGVGTMHLTRAEDLINLLLHGLFVHTYFEKYFYSISSPFWTIAIQMQFYAIFYFLVRLFGALSVWSRSSWARFFFATMILSFLCQSFLMARSTPWIGVAAEGLSPVLTHSILAHLPVFCLGCLTSYAFVLLNEMSPSNSAVTRFNTWDMIALCVFIIALYILGTKIDDYLNVRGGRYNWPVIPVLCSIFIVCVGRGLLVKQFLEFGLLRRLGEVSYGFYVFHLPCLSFCNLILQKTILSEAMYWSLLAVSGLLTTYAVAETSHRFIEKPFLNMLRRGSDQSHSGMSPKVGPR